MRSISRTLMILLIPIFIGCASKIKIDELSIEGDVFDMQSNRTIEDVEIKINHYEWDCPTSWTSTDGYYKIKMEDCYNFPSYLEVLNESGKTEIIFDIVFEHEKYHRSDPNKIRWDLTLPKKNLGGQGLKQKPPPPSCDPGYDPCVCLLCDPPNCCPACGGDQMRQWKDEIPYCEKKPPPDIEKPPTEPPPDYITFIIKRKNISDISFGLNGKSPEESTEKASEKEEPLIIWEEEWGQLFVFFEYGEQVLEINSTYNGESYRRFVKWFHYEVEGKENLKIIWNSQTKEFDRSWEK